MSSDEHNDIQDDILDLSEKIERLTRTAEETQRMVKNLYQRARMATVVVFIKWFVIIGVTLGSFYFLQPFLENTLNFYQSVAGGSGSGSSGSGLLDFMKSI